MPRRFPAPTRMQVIELARSGTRVAQLAATFGMSEMIRDGEAGLTFHREDASELVAVVERVMDDRELRIGPQQRPGSRIPPMVLTTATVAASHQRHPVRAC